MRVFEKPRLATHKRGTTPPIKQLSCGNVSLSADFTNTLFQPTPICKTSGSPLSTGSSNNFPKQPHLPPPLTILSQNQLTSTKPFSKPLATPLLRKPHMVRESGKAMSLIGGYRHVGVTINP